MKRERSVSDLLFSLSILFGSVAVFTLALDFLPSPLNQGVAFASAFAGGRLAQWVYPI